MSITLILAALSMGFFGSPHCLGMCGGIVTAFGMSMQGVSAGKKSALVATYHFGRLVSYGLLGMLASTVGMVVLAPFLHNNLPRILLGGILIVIGLAMCGMPLLTHLEKVGMRFWQQLTPLRQKVFPLDSFGKALFAGSLWGFLPCGLVYGALMMAVVAGTTAQTSGIPSPITGALLMFVFGLGTLPMLLATQKIVTVLRQAIGKFHLRQVNGGLLMVAGMLVIAMPLLMHQMHGGHMEHKMANHDRMSHEMPHNTMQHDMTNHSMMSHETMQHNGQSNGQQDMTPETMQHDTIQHDTMPHDTVPANNSSHQP